jgi:hypothetical protein
MYRSFKVHNLVQCVPPLLDVKQGQFQLVQDELSTSASGDYTALRLRLQRAEAANIDLEQVQFES